eukprot:CCRYP_006554-RC/>CCRYP_006554-RC protein AED:0.08 eAED:0.08 QI:641/1/1/1/0.6/0.5/6/420/595
MTRSNFEHTLAQSYTFFFLILHLLRFSCVYAEEARCSSANEFYCPLCGGVQVSDCTACEGYIFSDQKYEICYDRKLFNVKSNQVGDPENHYPYLWFDIAASIIWFLVAGVAVSCGVGGGGIYVPMGMILLRFPPKPSAGLSQACIFGAGIGGLIINGRKRHPDRHIRDTKGLPSESCPGKIVPHERNMTHLEIEADRKLYLQGGDGRRRFYTRPVIDYDLVLFMAPMELAGAVLGVTIQRLLPDWLFLSFAAVVLGFTCYKTFIKFKNLHRLEKEHNEEIANKNKVSQEISAAVQEEEMKGHSSKMDHVCQQDDDSSVSEIHEELWPAVLSYDDDDSEIEDISRHPDPKVIPDDSRELETRRQLLQEDSVQLPKRKIAFLLLLWVGLSVIFLLKGDKGAISLVGITCQDPVYYVLVACQFLWTIGFGLVFARKIIKQTDARKVVNYPYNETDVLWDLKSVRDFAFAGFGGGFIAGVIGISSGYFTGPFMVYYGIHPSVATATCATKMMFTSSSVALLFVLSGLLPWEYALYFFLVCLCGAVFGKTVVDAYVKKTGMASILVGVLACVIGLSTMSIIVILFVNLAKANCARDGDDL